MAGIASEGRASSDMVDASRVCIYHQKKIKTMHIQIALIQPSSPFVVTSDALLYFPSCLSPLTGSRGIIPAVPVLSESWQVKILKGAAQFHFKIGHWPQYVSETCLGV